MSEVTAVNPLSDTRINAETGVVVHVRSVPHSLTPTHHEFPLPSFSLPPAPGSSLFITANLAPPLPH